MQSTIVWTKDGYPRIADTVRATVKSIGRGQITTRHVAWAINSQLRGADARHQFSDVQVNRALRAICDEWPGFVANGHGVYRWHTGN